MKKSNQSKVLNRKTGEFEPAEIRTCNFCHGNTSQPYICPICHGDGELWVSTMETGWARRIRQQKRSSFFVSGYKKPERECTVSVIFTAFVDCPNCAAKNRVPVSLVHESHSIGTAIRYIDIIPELRIEEREIKCGTCDSELYIENLEYQQVKKNSNNPGSR